VLKTIPMVANMTMVAKTMAAVRLAAPKNQAASSERVAEPL
jgi:hypothetical protein